MKNNNDTKERIIKDIVEMLESTSILFLIYMQALIKRLLSNTNKGGE